MPDLSRAYHYVGPVDLAERARRGAAGGGRIDTPADLEAWVDASEEPPTPDGLVPATFVVDRGGGLRLAPRGSEHVVCAEGGDVLSAGEMFFAGLRLVEVTNQSTGYCPDPESWTAVARVLDRLGVPHPGGFTAAFVFRRCENCGELNVVKDDWFACAVCGSDLPRDWNCAL